MRSMRSLTRGTSRLRTLKTVKLPGSRPTCRSLTEARPKRSGHFTKSEFRYDAATDTYLCPAGQRLLPLYRYGLSKTRPRARIVSYVNREACLSCRLRVRCTTRANRHVNRYENEAIIERMAARLAARPEVMNHRRKSVEHPFGSVKQWMGQGAFLTRRLENVRGEFQSHRPGLQPATCHQPRGHSRTDHLNRQLSPCFARFQGHNQLESSPQAA